MHFRTAKKKCSSWTESCRLCFDHQAEEAATFYVSVFKNSTITTISRDTKAKAQRAMEALLSMKKLDIAEPERAAAEEPVGRRH